MLKTSIAVFFVVLCSILHSELIIGEISFEGNKLVTDAKLQSAISSYSGSVYDQSVINKDAQHISDYYSRKGLYNIKVQAPKIITNSPTQIDVIFQIEELGELNVNKIEFSGNSYIADDKLFSVISDNDKDLDDLQLLMKKILNYYTDNGFLFADVKLDSLKKINNDIIAFINIDEGRFCQFSEYKFSGNKITRDATLLNISRLQLTNKITPAILKQAENNIIQKKYIKSCEIVPLDHTKLLFQVEEDRMSIISGILGYDNSKSGNDKVTGWIDLQFMNLYGTDRSLALNWQSLGSDVSSVELKYHESGFLQYPVNADLLVFRQEVDSTYIRSKLESEIYYYDLYNRYGLFLGIEDIFPGNSNQIDIERTTFSKLGVLWDMSVLDNIANPKSGTEAYLKYYYIFNEIDNENITKQAIELSWAKYLNLGKRFVLSLDANAKVIERKQLTEFEVYDLGGATDLRGFNENAFSGFRVGWSDLELRYLFGYNSRLFIFGAYGYVENQNYKFDDLFSFGFGLRTQTKIGVLGIDYGLGISNGEIRNPLDGIIHIALETGL